MNETVTVDKAISKGHQMVTYPGMAIFIITILLSFYMVFLQFIPIEAFLFSAIPAAGLMWLWWSFMITKWRIWAFQHVRNVHELKKRAIQEKLIWKDNSFFEKLEIRSTSDKEKLTLLQAKFEEEDLFTNDPGIANETYIYYAKGKNFAEMVVMLACFSIGMYLLLTSDAFGMGLILTITGAIFAIKEYKEATNTTPQIIISDKGIKTITSGFHHWHDIKHEEVVSEGAGKRIKYYLVYEHPNGTEHLLIDDYNTEQQSLNKLLVLYRGRYQQNNTQHTEGS